MVLAPLHTALLLIQTVCIPPQNLNNIFTILATYSRLDPVTLLSSHLARYILLQREKNLKTPFSTLPPNVYLVFPDRSSIKLAQGSISRLQLPITLGFALSDYKVQGATFESAVVDLKRQSKVFAAAGHKRFCSTYVQLSRLQPRTAATDWHQQHRQSATFRPCRRRC